MAYEAEDVLHASLVLEWTTGDFAGTGTIIEASGVDLASVAEVAPGIVGFDLVEPLAFDEGIAAGQATQRGPGNEATNPLVWVVQTQDGGDGVTWSIAAWLPNGALPNATPVRAHVQLYQLNQGLRD